MQQFIDQHAKRPDISLRTIHIINQSLGRHVDGRPDVDIFEFCSSGLSKSEISYLSLCIMDEDVANFDVAMHDAMLCQIEQSFEDGFDVWFCLLFGEGVFLF